MCSVSPVAPLSHNINQGIQASVAVNLRFRKSRLGFREFCESLLISREAFLISHLSIKQDVYFLILLALMATIFLIPATVA
jgi:hypothetical protein